MVFEEVCRACKTTGQFTVSILVSAWGSRADDEKRDCHSVTAVTIIIADGPSRAAHAAHEGRIRIHFNFSCTIQLPSQRSILFGSRIGDE